MRAERPGAKRNSSTQCKDTKSYEHVNEHTTGRNILKQRIIIHNKKIQIQ